MRIKVISDGTALGNKVVNADTGEIVEGIIKAEITLEPFKTPLCIITFTNFGVEYEGEAIKKRYIRQ